MILSYRPKFESLLAAHAEAADFIEKPAAARLGPAPAATWIGRRLGAYRIVGELGSGGMSEVFRAVRADDEYHKEVAVKILRPGYEHPVPPGALQIREADAGGPRSPQHRADSGRRQHG